MMLNNNARVTTLYDLSREDHPNNEQLFIRPNDDQKAFAGDVWKFSDIKNWASKLVSDEAHLDFLPIVVAEPVGISNEYRLIIVNGKVITQSKYRSYHRLEIDPSVPNKVINFAEHAAKIYSPTPVFVMDIGLSGGKPYIIEIGCFNSVGFYACDINRVVRSVSNYIERNNI
jgi:hypothetical protein